MVTGGGSVGHIHPALATVRAATRLAAAGLQFVVVWTWTAGSLERQVTAIADRRLDPRGNRVGPVSARLLGLPEFVQTYKASLVTVRLALARLRQEGLAMSQQGVGNSPPPAHHAYHRSCS